MGAVIVGPWDGATEPSAKHDDHRAQVFRSWAEFIEEALEESDQPVIPMQRDDLTAIAKNHRVWEHGRLKSLELQRMQGGRQQVRRAARDDHHRELADRMVHRLVALEKQIRRQRNGTALHTLDGLDAMTCGVLWSAGIATVEELVKHTRRRNWLIKGVGPQRRAQIIEALKSAPNEGEN